MPALKVVGEVTWNVVEPDLSIDSGGVLVMVAPTPLTYACVMFTVVVPEFWTSTSMLLVPVNAMFAIDACSAFPIRPMVIPPIHAATTTLTATVTAIKMIDATTGLSAFAFFLNFLKVFIFFFPFVCL